jgi:catechol 1,2-dioxygenase
MDQSYTDHVISVMGPRTSPRLREVLGSLIQHMHDFTRENQITVEEWMAGVEFINAIGKMTDEKRDEGILVSDIFGIESYFNIVTG